MRRSIIAGLSALAVSMLLISGCAKDQVKPDEGLAAQKPPVQQAAEPKKETPPQVPAKPAEQINTQQIKDDVAAGLVKSAPQVADASQLSAYDAARQALARIYFEFDSYALSQTSRDTLYGNADYLLKKYKGRVRLEGHCDERGSDEYNLALGENRAKAAMNYLITLGVPPEQMTVVSYGKERPLNNGHDEESWAKNRRVEFEVIR